MLDKARVANTNQLTMGHFQDCTICALPQIIQQYVTNNAYHLIKKIQHVVKPLNIVLNLGLRYCDEIAI